MAVGETQDSIEQSYRAATAASLEAFERACRVMPGGAKGAYFYPPYPLFMERGEGCMLVDVDGRRYVDFANHHTAQVLGHCHPAVGEAVARQLERGVALGAPSGIETALAEELCDRVESLERVRFCNSGTESTLHAVRLARGLTGRPLVAKFEGGYHGSHDAVEISVAPPLGQAGPADAPRAVAGVKGLAPGAVESAVILPYDDLSAVEAIVERHAESLACILFDAKAGILDTRPEFARAVRELARRLDIPFILDEVVSFRVARGGWQQVTGIDPDLTTFGKLIGGGFPVGAFGGRAELMDPLDTTSGPTGFFQSGTFSAHPVTMAAGLATLEQLTPDAFDHLDSLGRRLRDGLNDLFDRRGQAARAVGAGSLFSVYFSDRSPRSYRDLAAADRTPTRPVFLSLLSQGYFLSQGLAMNALSLPMQSEHVDGLVAAFETALDEVAGETGA